MAYQLVVTATAVQLTILCVMLIALAVRKAIAPAVRRRSATEAESLLAAVREWLAGELTVTELDGRLSAASEDAVATVLRSVAVTIRGSKWDALVERARASRWFAGVMHHGRSKLWWRRVTAARAVALVGSREDLAVLNRLLRDRVHRVRLAAVSCLDRIADHESLTLTLELALDSEPIFRSYLLSCLKRHGEALLPILLEALPRVQAPGHASAILDLMAELGDPRYLESLIGRGEDADARVRRAAARALGRFPHPQSSRSLRDLLRDPDSDVRATAASSLGLLHAVEARAELVSALTDASPNARQHAALALRMLGAEGSEALREHLASPRCIDAGLPRYVLGLSEAAVRTQAGLAS